MRILFLADNFPPERNAQASRVYERACYWVQWGHSVTVLTCAPNYPEGKLFEGYKNRWYGVSEMNGIRVVRVKTFIARNAGKVLRIFDFLSFMVTSFVAGLFQPRPDMVVATSPQFFGAVSGCALAAVRRVPFVLELSDLWPDSIVAVGAMKKSLALRLLERVELFLYARAVRIVTLTQAFKDNLVRRGVPGEKIAVVLNGVDLSRYAPRGRDAGLAGEWGIAEGDFVAGYIGTFGMAHALTNVLDAAALADDPTVRFLLVGTGAEREKVIAEAVRRGLRNVVFVPAQPKERMPEFWGLCDIALVHLKDAELFRSVIPSKIFEAMGMGLPILLACPEGEASRIVLQERAGVWVPAEDPRALWGAVRQLKNDVGTREGLASGSHAAAARYSRERQASGMLAVLDLVQRQATLSARGECGLSPEG